MQSALTQQLKQFHKNEPDVVQVLSSPSRHYVKAFKTLWKRGIYLHKLKVHEKEQPSFIRERKEYSGNLEKDLVIFTSYSGFYSKQYRARYQIHSCKDSGQVMMPVAPVIKSLAKITVIDNDDDYKAFLIKMILDDVSILAKSRQIYSCVREACIYSNKCKQETI